MRTKFRMLLVAVVFALFGPTILLAQAANCVTVKNRLTNVRTTNEVDESQATSRGELEKAWGKPKSEEKNSRYTFISYDYGDCSAQFTVLSNGKISAKGFFSPNETITGSTLPETSPAQGSSAAGSKGSAVHEVFSNVTLNLEVGDKKKEIESAMKYTDSALHITDKRTGATIKTFPYQSVKAMEYSYSKSPRWKTAIFVSPLFLFSSGKKHWLAIQGNGDYAVMQLDKTNFKLILAALEAKTGKKVETVEESK